MDFLRCRGLISLNYRWSPLWSLLLQEARSLGRCRKQFCSPVSSGLGARFRRCVDKRNTKSGGEMRKKAPRKKDGGKEFNHQPSTAEMHRSTLTHIIRRLWNEQLNLTDGLELSTRTYIM